MEAAGAQGWGFANHGLNGLGGLLLTPRPNIDPCALKSKLVRNVIANTSRGTGSMISNRLFHSGLVTVFVLCTCHNRNFSYKRW